MVGGVEFIQMLHKATVCLPGPPEEPAKVMSRLRAYNPTLNMSGWRTVKVSKDSGRQDTGEKYVLVFQLLESQVRALEALRGTRLPSRCPARLRKGLKRWRWTRHNGPSVIANNPD